MFERLKSWLKRTMNFQAPHSGGVLFADEAQQYREQHILAELSPPTLSEFETELVKQMHAACDMPYEEFITEIDRPYSSALHAFQLGLYGAPARRPGSVEVLLHAGASTSRRTEFLRVETPLGGDGFKHFFETDDKPTADSIREDYQRGYDMIMFPDRDAARLFSQKYLQPKYTSYRGRLEDYMNQMKAASLHSESPHVTVTQIHDEYQYAFEDTPEGRAAQANIAKLPPFCFVNLETMPGQCIQITAGRSDLHEVVSGHAHILNRQLGVTQQQIAAMLYGAVMGWHLPGANPDNYDMNGRPKTL